MRLVSILDPGYPENLRAVDDRPPFVFVAGRLTPADTRSVAVIGARAASARGAAAAVAIAEHLVDCGYSRRQRTRRRHRHRCAHGRAATRAGAPWP